MRTCRIDVRWLVGIAVLLGGRSGQAEDVTSVPLARGKRIEFLSGPAAKNAIVEDQHDPFLKTVSRIDCELRLSEPLEDVAPPMRVRLLKQQLAGAVTPFTAGEQELLVSVGREVQAKAEELHPRFIPGAWKFVKTDGTDEGGAAYTRHDCIVLPEQKLSPAVLQPSPVARQSLRRLVAHETAHVFSRANPELREKLYAVFGFQHVGPITLGSWLEERRITNPDGPTIEHVLRLKTNDGTPFEGALVTYSKVDRYAPGAGRKLFDSLRFGIVAVDQRDGMRVVRAGPDGVPIILDLEQVDGFYERIGRNTRYVIHPDEILAENLAILLTEETHAPGAALDFAILRRVEEILRTDGGQTPR